MNMLKKTLVLSLFWIFLFSLIACSKPEKQLGEFYTLQEAYDNEWLTQENLLSIAYYLNADSMPMYPEPLSKEIEKAIKETRASYLREQIDATGKLYHPNATVDDVDIIGYYGKYNGCYAVMIEDSFTVYGQAPWSETVNGITFYYGDGNRIYIWRAEKEFD